MPIDTRMYGDIVQPYVPNPALVRQHVARIRGEEADTAFRQAQTQKLLGDLADEEKVKQILSESGGDMKAAAPKVMAVNPRLGIAFQKELDSMDSARLSRTTAELKQHEAEFSLTGQLMGATTNQDEWSRNRQELITRGIRGADRLPEAFDPATRDTIRVGGMTAAEQTREWAAQATDAYHKKLATEAAERNRIAGEAAEQRATREEARQTLADKREDRLAKQGIAESGYRMRMLDLQNKREDRLAKTDDPVEKRNLELYKQFLDSHQAMQTERFKAYTAQVGADPDKAGAPPTYQLPPNYDAWLKAGQGMPAPGEPPRTRRTQQAVDRIRGGQAPTGPGTPYAGPPTAAAPAGGRPAPTPGPPKVGGFKLLKDGRLVRIDSIDPDGKIHGTPVP